MFSTRGQKNPLFTVHQNMFKTTICAIKINTQAECNMSPYVANVLKILCYRFSKFRSIHRSVCYFKENECMLLHISGLSALFLGQNY